MVDIRGRAYSIYQGFWRPLFAPFTSGDNIYDYDWDLLIILDGCRVDVLKELDQEFEFLSTVASKRSVGSQSKEWLAKTFTPDRIQAISATAYVTANPFTENVFVGSDNERHLNPANWDTVDETNFGELLELWRTGWDENLDTVPPRTVTDATVTVGREGRHERVIAHYMQPHEPFISQSDSIVRDVWQQLRDGTLDIDVARELYRDNLRYVLEEVELLLSNFDADQAVITSDHGNAFGEWGIYGHPIGFQHPVVKNVPWAVTEGNDTGSHDPEPIPESTDESTLNPEERLQALGYRE